MKKEAVVIIIIIATIIIVTLIRPSPNNENNWIKDKKGIWIKQGSPSQTSQEVIEQQELISQALALYNQKKAEGIQFSSQCLGTINDYVIDMVHVPRSAEDNLPENQCEDFRLGKAAHFLEIDKDGNIVRIV